MLYAMVITILILAIWDWIAVGKGWRSIEYVAKPVTMLALLLWLGVIAGFGGSMLWFAIGVFFCLAGDVFLMLPFDMFILGLLSFLLGHVSYIVGMNNHGPYINLLGGVLVVLLAISFGWLYPKFTRGLSAKGKNGLKLPVLIYSLVISLMVYSAVMTWTRLGWPTVASLSISLGALLFYASDAMLAWDRFYTPLRHAHLRVMITYHLGQIGIILGAILYAQAK